MEDQVFNKIKYSVIIFLKISLLANKELINPVKDICQKARAYTTVNPKILGIFADDWLYYVNCISKNSLRYKIIIL